MTLLPFLMMQGRSWPSLLILIRLLITSDEITEESES